MAKKKVKKKRKYTKICPKCKSVDVHIDKSNPLQPSMGLPAMYICNKCKYCGYNFPEMLIEKLKKVEKEPNKTEKKEKSSLVDTTYGRFQVNIMWKITAPIILLLGLFLIFYEPPVGVVLILIGVFMSYITYFKRIKSS